MREQSCYQFCDGCEGCRRYDSGLVKCKNCAPEYRRCSCRLGVRRFLTSDGFIAVKEFGRVDRSGRDVTLGPLVRIRKILP